MHTLALAIFWLCAGLLIYGHLGYPVLLALRAKKFSRPVFRGDALPKLAVVVVAHNEAERIEARLENLLAQNYPKEKLLILLGSDGSTDATVVRARAYGNAFANRPGDARVEVIDCPQQRGKPSVINELVSKARAAGAELVVLADARQDFEAEALRALAAPFADPGVGAVSGELVIDGAGGGGLYWSYEKFLRKQESSLDSTIGATGAIYAIRAGQFEPIASDTVLDDMLIPLQIARRGLRIIFESLAVAHDRPASPRAEFLRKARTLSGNFQLFARERWLLSPTQNRLWLQTVSHKLLRLACPLLLVGALLSNLFLAGKIFYAFTLLAQLAFYALALLGLVIAREGKSAKIPSAAYLFCLLHWATVIGFVRFLRGQANAAWKRAPISISQARERPPSSRVSTARAR